MIAGPIRAPRFVRRECLYQSSPYMPEIEIFDVDPRGLEPPGGEGVWVQSTRFMDRWFRLKDGVLETCEQMSLELDHGDWEEAQENSSFQAVLSFFKAPTSDDCS